MDNLLFVFSRTICDIIDGDVDTGSSGGEIDGDDQAYLHHGVEHKVGDGENGGCGDGHGVDDSAGGGDGDDQAHLHHRGEHRRLGEVLQCARARH